MGFAVVVEALNLRMKRNRKPRTPPVEFHERRMPDFAAASDGGDAADASDIGESAAGGSEQSV
ncbi:MAG: hypothetical protein OXN87_03440, partial [Chloroflexota bacterium]|nr:hypothetical protein [Chloroflexota bacterium]